MARSPPSWCSNSGDTDEKQSTEESMIKGSPTTLEQVDQLHDPDVTLTFPGTEKVIQVHRKILSSASPRFNYLFHHEISEDSKVEIQIKDHSFESMNMLIQYVYSRKLEIPSVAMAIELHSCAYEYLVDPLLDSVRGYILEKVSEENVLAVFFEAMRDEGMAWELIMACIEIFKEHELEDSWIQLLRYSLRMYSNQ